MATGPALQLTGTLIGADARYWAQDQDSNNPAVSAADMLLRINDRLLWWQVHVHPRVKTLGATSTGLTFSAGEVSKTVTNDLGILEILSLHHADGTSIAYPVGVSVPRRGVQVVNDSYGKRPGSATPTPGTEIEVWGAEMDQQAQDDWRVFIYPAVATSVTIRANIP